MTLFNIKSIANICWVFTVLVCAKYSARFLDTLSLIQNIACKVGIIIGVIIISILYIRLNSMFKITGKLLLKTQGCSYRGTNLSSSE